MRAVTILSLAALVALSMSSLGLASEKKAEIHHIHGAVVSVDAAAKTLTVKETLKSGTTKDVAFTVDEKTKVMIHGKAGKLDEVKAADSVQVRFHKMGSMNHAVEVSVVESPAKKT